MNFVAHALVASRLVPGHGAFGLGAMAPDLASMSRIRLDRDRLPAEVLAGVGFHAVTDAAFHSAPGVVALMADLRARLITAGLGVGASRAVGHVGVELLLDGVLLDRPDARLALLEAMAERQQITGSLQGETRDAWARIADRVAAARDALPYRHPGTNAELLQRMLAQRPKLSFLPEHVPAVAAELAGTLAELVPLTDDIVEITIARLPSRSWWPVPR
jgi:hypothetical protein